MQTKQVHVGIGVLIAALIGLSVVPVFAQTDDYGTTTGTYCPRLFQTVVRGSSGNQVLELQKFLSDYYDILPATIQTGYFGRITQGYVIQFQKEQGLPAYGIAGSMTRTAIAKVCGTKPIVQTCPQYQIPICANGQHVQRGATDLNGCQGAPMCVNDTVVQSCPVYNACPLGYTSNTSTDANGCTILQCTPPTSHATLNLPGVLSADSCAASALSGGTTASITDPNNALASLSKQAIEALGVSDQYFQNHFQFICAQNIQGDNLVRWRYAVGEFASTLDDMFGFYTDSGGVHYKSNFSQDFGTPFVTGSIGEVNSVVTKQAAADAMQACIGDFTDAHMYLGNPTDGGYARPMLRATPAVNGTICPAAGLGPCRIKTGWIDLTTGKCTKNF